MNTDRLDAKAVEKISGKSWDTLRPDFEAINDRLLAVSASATGALTTIYIKYASPETSGNPYGVVWVKKASEIIVGLSLPVDIEHHRLVAAPKGCKYAGLTKYLVVNRKEEVPREFRDWCKKAYAEACGVQR